MSSSFLTSGVSLSGTESLAVFSAFDFLQLFLFFSSLGKSAVRWLFSTPASSAFSFVESVEGAMAGRGWCATCLAETSLGVIT